MKAVVQDRYGDADVLAVRDIEEPAPADGRCWSGCVPPGSIPAPGT